MTPKLSDLAWAVLDQLKKQEAVEDGDIVSKSGRKELERAGLAIRTRGHHDLAVTNLTAAGLAIAARYQPENWGRA